jgi:hypothetical protein
MQHVGNEPEIERSSRGSRQRLTRLATSASRPILLIARRDSRVQGTSIFQEFSAQAAEFDPAPLWKRPIGAQHRRRFGEVSSETNSVPTHESGAPGGQPFVGVVVGVSDLSVRDPDHRFVASSLAKCPTQDRTVNAVSYVARRIRSSHLHSIA